MTAQPYGPNTPAVEALLAQVRAMTPGQVEKAAAAWGAAWSAARGAARYAAWSAARGAARSAAWDAAWYAAWDAARDAAWDAARDAAWDAARGAALALVVRDLIPTEHFDTLAGPLRAAGLTITQEDQ